LALLKSNSEAMTLTRIVLREMCILQFRTEAKFIAKSCKPWKSHKPIKDTSVASAACRQTVTHDITAAVGAWL